MRPPVAAMFLALAAGTATADEAIISARYAEPTDRYPHGALGDRLEWGALVVERASGAPLTYRIEDASVFEDMAPRLYDIDDDGAQEAWVVRADANDGARLEAYAVVDGRLVRRFAGPAIGRGFRWLNPVGVADFDGDGAKEAAYVETPHIGGILTVLERQGERLEIAARLQSYSNHKIGSTSLDLAAVADLDGDGAADIVLPNQVHDRLAVVSYRGERLIERWRSQPLPPVGGGLTLAPAGAGQMARYVDRSGAVVERPVWTAACDRGRFRIAIDVGHHDAAPGAISARGVPERAFNLRLARVVSDRLAAQGFGDRFLIAESGDKISLKARVQVANERSADAFISIHHDSAQPHLLTPWTYEGRELRYTDEISGFSLFVSGENVAFAQARRLARQLGEEMVAAGFVANLNHADPIDGEGRDLLDRRLGVYRWDGLGVVRTTRMPAVLLEAGVILNRADELKLAEPETQHKIAAAVVRALDAFLCADPAQ